MKITYNNINNQTFVSVYLLPGEEINIDSISELKKKHKHVALMRGGARPYKETLIKALAI
ncbi:MAG: hypothetical protein N3I35_10700 [Clostridia bacterium]|nr:hypothetical protein [Clostridia bacterium]